MLKKRVKSLNDVEEKFRGLYKKDGDEFVLDIEVETDKPADNPDTAKLNEFRQNNIELQKKLAAAEATLRKFDGVDPEAARQAADVLSKLKADEERELIKAGKFEEVIERRTSAMKANYEKQMAALQAARDEATKKGTDAITQLSQIRVNETLMKALAKSGALRKGAEVDALARGRSVFKLGEDGKTLTPDAGGAAVFGKKGEPLTPEEWASDLQDAAPYLWEPTGGGGSKGGNSPTNGPGGKRVLRNPTPQEMGAHLDAIAAGEVVVVRD